MIRAELQSSFAIRAPDDFHLHLRRGAMLRRVIEYSCRYFRRALVMPNTEPPIVTADDVNSYEREILSASLPFAADFRPLMTVQLTERTLPRVIRSLSRKSVVAGKIYPRSQTTNSDNGVVDYTSLDAVFAEMEELGLVLCLHGESPDPGVFCLDREAAFLSTLDRIARTWPGLRIVLEHITSAAAVRAIQESSDNVRATVTPHHLVLTLDDVIGDKLRPHLFCKPIAKTSVDRDAIVAAVLSGDPKFFLGTDSAPHTRAAKECDACSAGIFNAPVALSFLAEFFESHGCMDRLEAFVSQYGARFYGLPLNEGEMTFIREPWTVPNQIGQLVPFMAGRTLQWRPPARSCGTLRACPTSQGE